MKINPNTNIIKIQVTLSGKNGYSDIIAALDTGASYLMIPWGVAEKLGYDPARSRKTIPIVTAFPSYTRKSFKTNVLNGSGTEKVPLITIDKVRALGVM